MIQTLYSRGQCEERMRKDDKKILNEVNKRSDNNGQIGARLNKSSFGDV